MMRSWKTLLYSIVASCLLLWAVVDLKSRAAGNGFPSKPFVFYVWLFFLSDFAVTHVDKKWWVWPSIWSVALLLVWWRAEFAVAYATQCWSFGTLRNLGRPLFDRRAHGGTGDSRSAFATNDESVI